MAHPNKSGTEVEQSKSLEGREPGRPVQPREKGDARIRARIE